MTGTIGPDVARAAVALHGSHPQSTALDILDVCLRQRTGRVSDFGPAVEPGEPFALLIADAFDKGMTRDEWLWVKNPSADPKLVAALIQIWKTDVLPRFTAHYGLTL